MLVECWVIVEYDGPTLNQHLIDALSLYRPLLDQHWFNGLCLFGREKLRSSGNISVFDKYIVFVGKYSTP